jgi:hypothetical protein
MYQQGEGGARSGTNVVAEEESAEGREEEAG